MTRLCLVRHGQTDWNLQGRYQGQSDVPLNDIGRAQAWALAQRLQPQHFAAIYTSELLRAKETADLIGGCLGLPSHLEPRLREINQGEWEGQLVDDIKERYTTLWRDRFIDPIGIRAPGGESVLEVATRVFAALDDIARQWPCAQVLVVSHGLALATAICRSRNISVEHAYATIPPNTEPIWIQWAE